MGDAEQCLRSIPALLARVASIVGVPLPRDEAALIPSSIEFSISSILERLPAKLHTYTIMQPVEVGETSTHAPVRSMVAYRKLPKITLGFDYTRSPSTTFVMKWALI